MRVDLVAAPIRYPRAPLLALLLLTLVPALALGALYVWSDEEADVYELYREESASDTIVPVRPQSRGDVAPALATGMFSYRRAASEAAVRADDHVFVELMEPMYGFVNDGSCIAVSIDGRNVTSENPNTSLMPASTQKLIVAAVALEVLGEDYRFVTTASAPPATDGVIDGDLFLIGGGDPVLTTNDYPIADDRYPAFNTTSLDVLADAIVAAGITSIAGQIVGDGTRYDDQFVVASWGEGIAFVEAGPYDALLVNDSRTLGQLGRQADPSEAAAREFARLLGNRGVLLGNGTRSGVADSSAVVIATIESEPLSAIVAEMLTTSDNNTAEMLLKELGYVDSGEGTLAAGLNVLDRTLREWGVPMDGVRLVDGSGLSVDNRTTCAALLAVLQRAADGSLPAGLPVAATSGTLTAEFVDSAVAGRLMAKTGTLGNPPIETDPPAIKALAGYLDTERGNRIEFVILQTGPDVTSDGKYVPLWIALGERLATYPDGPGADVLGPG